MKRVASRVALFCTYSICRKTGNLSASYDIVCKGKCGMKKAFSEILNKEVSAEEVNKNESLKVGLKCRDCVIPMSHRRAHKWYESVVTACFVRQQEHIESCQYYAVGQMGILARLSDDDVLSRLDKKNFIFRLTMIHDELDGK